MDESGSVNPAAPNLRSLPTTSPFLLVFGNPETREHLKEEVKARFPYARFAFSSEKLTSFKHAKGHWELKNLPELYVAENVALFVAKAKQGGASDGLSVQLGSFPVPSGFRLFSVEVKDEIWWGLQKNDRADPVILPVEYSIETGDGADARKLPSRSYYKLKEMAEVSGAKIGDGDTVLEVGCAPGGMSLYALDRGASVIGIDRGVVSQIVRQNERFHQLHYSIADTPEEELPESFDWLVIDMHAEPQVLFRECKFLFKRAKKGIFLTLKLNKPDTIRQVPRIHEELERIGKWKFSTLRQLPSHHQEVCFMGRAE